MMSGATPPNIHVPLTIEGQDMSMPLDTGCALTLAPKRFYNKYCSHLALKTTDLVLNTYTNEKINPLGEVTVRVRYKDTVKTLPLLITRQGSTALFGRN